MKYVVLFAIFAILGSIATAAAQTGIEIRPEAPPGLGEKINTLLNWVYWIALVAAIMGVIWSAISLFTGRDTKLYLFIAIIVLAFLVALPEILKAIGV